MNFLIKRVLTVFFLMPCIALGGEVALDIRTFPEGPLYSNQVGGGLQVSDVVLHNIGIINRGPSPVEVEKITLSVVNDDATLVSRIIDGRELEKTIDRVYRNAKYGVFDRLPELFGHDRMFANGEKLSAMPKLEPNSALATFQGYLAYQGVANGLRVSVDYRVAGQQAQAGTKVLTIPIEQYESPNAYRLPLKGRWYLLTGPDVSGHHRAWQNTEFAYDFSRTGAGGSLFANEGLAPSDYYAYGQPIFAVADGVVVKAIDRYPEAPLREQGESVSEYQNRMSDRMNRNFINDPDANYGNVVLIEHEGGELSMYTHLKRGSLLVEVGAKVIGGEPLGEVGQSGNSLRPHLHFAMTLRSGRSVPVTFGNIRSIDGEKLSRMLRTGEFVMAE